MSSRPPGFAARLLRFPTVTYVAVALGVLLCLPALWMGFFADDYLQLLILEGRAGDHSPLDLYRFTGRDAAESARSFARGPWPWFGDPEVHAGFLRPLSSALLVLDHGVFGSNAAGYHAHGLLWYAALIATAAALYRRAAPAGVGALALLLFAVDDAHAMSAGWIAGRHAVVAAVPAMLGLLAHLRAREDGWRPGRWLGVAAFAVGLAGGETAVAVLAYVLAYEAWGHAASLRDRARALAPYAALGAVYLGLYKALGYGVQGSSQYLDPLGRPGQYAAELPGRFAALSGGQIVGAITDVWMFDPRSHMPLVAAGVLGLALFTWLLRGALRDAPEDERRRVRFWLAGALLSLFVVTTGTLGNRLLLAPGLGAFVGIAFVLRHAWRVARRRVPASGPSRVAHVLSVGVLGLVHCVASPLLLAASLESMGRRAAAAVRLTSAENVVPAPGAHVVILATADGIPALFGGGHRMFAPEPRPAGWHLLSVDPVDHRLTRTGPRTLELAVLGDVAGPDPGDLLRRLLRRPEAPLRAGQEVRLDCGHVRVLDAPGGRPVRIEITFDGDIGGPGFSFLVLDEDAFRTVALPEQGSAIEIAIHPPALPF